MYPSQTSLWDAQDANKHRLLLLYIHGFNGSEDSFHNFPAHVHDVLAGLLSESHVVYSRVYPQYQTRGELQAAVDNVSAWISPYEADDLDIILLGHSLGGIVASETALLSVAPGMKKPKHRILGLVNFDVPFIGIDSTVLRSGIGSLFQQNNVDQRAKDEDMTRLDPAFQMIAVNPEFIPPLSNNNERNGRLHSMKEYLHKHVRHASPSMVDNLVSYYKFAGCLNRPAELRERYERLMEFESAERGRRRMRFVNYYTETGASRLQRFWKENAASRLGKSHESKTFPVQKASSDTLGVPYKRTATTDPHNGLLASGKQRLKQAASDSSLVAHWTNIKTKQSPSQSSVEFHHATAAAIEPSSSTDLRKFVRLPSDDGGNNSLWIPVSMKNMDPVTAHQCMFFAKEAGYDRLVGDTVSQIEKWIQDDLSQEALLQMA